jgi:hypothetical protein
MSDERLEQVRLLRQQGHSPKQIARKLAITPAQAGRLVREAAASDPADPAEPPLIGCWVSPNWSTDLIITGDHPDWPLHSDPESGTTGLVAVLVAREHRHGKVSVCSYLCDVYCLGVKNTDGPDVMDHIELRPFRNLFFSGFHGEPLQAPIELARELVLGSIHHARNLGFEPHPDFTAAQQHLGGWDEPGTITFGQNGKPFYISGPYDDPRQVIRTLERTAGTGNYDYALVPE